jgi:beta-mannosidase
VSRGVDYECEVRINGKARHHQAGMHTPFEMDLTAEAKGGTLEVVVFPAPFGESQPLIERRPRADCKPPVAYGWDFHPRLIPLGIWDDTSLVVRPAAHLRRVYLFYTLAPDFSAAALHLEVDMSGHGRVRWQLTDDAGVVVVRADNTLSARLQPVRRHAGLPGYPRPGVAGDHHAPSAASVACVVVRRQRAVQRLVEKHRAGPAHAAGGAQLLRP